LTHVFAGRFGATVHEGGVHFRLFAPAAHGVRIVFDGGPRSARMTQEANGWFAHDESLAGTGTRYAFCVDDSDELIPDPASRFQPDGPHGASEVIDPKLFSWPETSWNGRAMHEQVVYELHLGAFSASGTYAGAVAHLDHLADIGVTAVEVMPLSSFPGKRNWGYDGTFPYAPCAVYGRPDDFKRFIVEAHRRKLAVILDVVYNHFGPEGNYLHMLAPEFFTEKYKTPWGAAINFEGIDLADVRAFFIENARYWIEEYRIDGLRLDATQMIFDTSTPPVLHELRDAIMANVAPDRRVTLVVENENNDVSLLRAGYDGQWNDDVHHCMHVLATGETGGYYRDYAEKPAWFLAKALATGYAFQGDESRVRPGVRRGAPSADFPLSSFVNCLQNHDQIGNRACGERICAIAPEDAVRAMTSVLLLAPSPPLLFMGEEWNASTPFLFFCDFEPGLAKLVTEGRRREFAQFPEFANDELRETIPDPSAPATFAASRLHWDELEEETHARINDGYRTLLHVRNEEIVPRAERVRGTDATFSTVGERGIAVSWRMDDGAMLELRANLGDEPLAGLATAPGRTLYATHEGTSENDVPAWYVRWSLA
jgi:malto-oligosyltrehalose trehalohydrolase